MNFIQDAIEKALRLPEGADFEVKESDFDRFARKTHEHFRVDMQFTLAEYRRRTLAGETLICGHVVRVVGRENNPRAGASADVKTERVARAICAETCRPGHKIGQLCIDPQTHMNAPCRATVNQLVLDGIWREAEAAIAAMRGVDGSPA